MNVRQGALAGGLLAVCSALVLSLIWMYRPAAQDGLPRVMLPIGTAWLEVQVASTELQLQRGLMYRKSMPADEGMAFVFEAGRQPTCFWTKNTPLALSAIFVDPTGHVVHVAQMRPNSERLHCAIAPVSFVIEANAGWFESRGVRQGTVLPDLASALSPGPDA